MNSIQQKLPGITPPLLTPGGRRLPPLGLSPGSHISIPATPGGTLWNSLLNATNTDSQTNTSLNQQQAQTDMVSVSMHPHPHQQNYGQSTQSRAQMVPQASNPPSQGLPPVQVVGQPNQQGPAPGGAPGTQVAPPPDQQQQPPQQSQAQAAPQGPPQIHLQPSGQPGQPQLQPGQQGGNYSQYGNNSRKSGLTPNESNLRTGLTPGGNQHNNGNSFPFNSHLSGFTPNGNFNSPMTPGLSSLLGLSHGQSHNPSLHMQNSQSIQNQNTQAGVQLPPQQNHLQFQGHASQGVQQQRHQGDMEKSPRSLPDSPSQDGDNGSENGKRKMKESKEGTKKPKSGRGRKPKPKDPAGEPSIKKDPEDVSPMYGDDTDQEGKGTGKKKGNEQDKRKHFLERNRLAASKCRQRKKQMAAKMEDELKFFSAGYRDLTTQVLQLREQLISYRNVFTDHKSCPMLAQQLGGYNTLNDMLQQTNYIIQATEKNQDAIHPLPSTIATALSNNQDMDSSMGNDENNSSTSNPHTNPSNNEAYDTYNGPTGATANVSHNIPLDHHAVANSGATSTSSIPNGYVTVPGSGNISTHHSMTDLPAVAAAAMAGNTSSVPPQNINNNPQDGGVNIHQPQASDIRAINSMTNLEALNHDSNLQGLAGNQNANPANNQGNFNLRAVSSMIDLHQINHQNNLVNMGHNT